MSISGNISMINKVKTVNVRVLLIRNDQLYGSLVNVYPQL